MAAARAPAVSRRVGGSVLSASLGAAHQGRHLLRAPFSRWVDTLLNQAGARDAPPRKVFLLWHAPETKERVALMDDYFAGVRRP